MCSHYKGLCGAFSQHYSEARGAAACSDCPANAATTERGSRSLSDCLCKPGYYFATAPGEDCKPCPTGGSCPGGLQRPYPTRGYWTDLTAAQAAGIYRCNPTSSCAGGPTSQCTANFGGPLCYQCSVGFFSVFGSCAKCQSTGVTVLILLLVLALWFLINFIVFTRVGILDVAITLFQLLSITGQMNVAWPLPLQRFFAVAKLFAFEIDIISPVCAAPGWGYKDSLLVQLLLPVGFAALYFGAHAARVLAAARRRRRRHAAKAAAAADDDQAERHALEASLDNSVAATLSVVSVSYVALTQYSLGAFQCTALGGRSVLVAAPSVDCASGDYRSIVVLGVVGTCVYVVGAPLLFGAVLYRLYRRKVLETRRQLGRFGWLYEAYRVRWCWFGLAELAHRGIYIACVIFIAGARHCTACAIEPSAAPRPHAPRPAHGAPLPPPPSAPHPPSTRRARHASARRRPIHGADGGGSDGGQALRAALVQRHPGPADGARGLRGLLWAGILQHPGLCCHRRRPHGERCGWSRAPGVHASRARAAPCTGR